MAGIAKIDLVPGRHAASAHDGRSSVPLHAAARQFWRTEDSWAPKPTLCEHGISEVDLPKIPHATSKICPTTLAFQLAMSLDPQTVAPSMLSSKALPKDPIPNKQWEHYACKAIQCVMRDLSFMSFPDEPAHDVGEDVGHGINRGDCVTHSRVEALRHLFQVYQLPSALFDLVLWHTTLLAFQDAKPKLHATTATLIEKALKLQNKHIYHSACESSQSAWFMEIPGLSTESLSTSSRIESPIMLGLHNAYEMLAPASSVGYQKNDKIESHMHNRVIPSMHAGPHSKARATSETWTTLSRLVRLTQISVDNKLAMDNVRHFVKQFILPHLLLFIQQRNAIHLPTQISIESGAYGMFNKHVFVILIVKGHVYWIDGNALPGDPQSCVGLLHGKSNAHVADFLTEAISIGLTGSPADTLADSKWFAGMDVGNAAASSAATGPAMEVDE